MFEGIPFSTIPEKIWAQNMASPHNLKKKKTIYNFDQTYSKMGSQWGGGETPKKWSCYMVGAFGLPGVPQVHPDDPQLPFFINLTPPGLPK